MMDNDCRSIVQVDNLRGQWRRDLNSKIHTRIEHNHGTKTARSVHMPKMIL